MNDSTKVKGVARRATIEAGLFSADSLFVRFDFTQARMLAAAKRYLEAISSQKPVEMPSEIKTYVHELSHYLHYTTTPYGLFLSYCRVLQNHATIEIVRALLDAGISFNLPLLLNLPSTTGEVSNRVQRGLSCWLNVEHFVAMLNGDRKRREALANSFLADCGQFENGEKPRRPPLLSLKEAFALIQDSIAGTIEGANADALAMGNLVPIDPAGFDWEMIRREMTELPTADDLAVLRTEFMLEVLGNPWSVEAIVESAATAAEYWGSDIGYDRFATWVNAEVDPELQLYRTCIKRGLDAIPTKKLSEFIPSYMALCELAMYTPLLPQHAGLRRHHPDLRQILPTFRWQLLIGASANVAPIRSESDHSRYIADILRELDWVPPMKIIDVALKGPDQFSNPLAWIYLSAQRLRARHSGAFLGINRYLFDPSPEANAWRYVFNFVILDYTDRTTYHVDKGFLQAMTTRYLNTLSLRCIMEGESLTIAAPYRGDEAEKRWMTMWLRDRFKTLFGRDFHMLKVV